MLDCASLQTRGPFQFPGVAGRCDPLCTMAHWSLGTHPDAIVSVRPGINSLPEPRALQSHYPGGSGGPARQQRSDRASGWRTAWHDSGHDFWRGPRDGPQSSLCIAVVERSAPFLGLPGSRPLERNADVRSACAGMEHRFLYYDVLRQHYRFTHLWANGRVTVLRDYRTGTMGFQCDHAAHGNGSSRSESVARLERRHSPTRNLYAANSL